MKRWCLPSGMQCVAQSAEARNAAAEENEVGNLTFWECGGNFWEWGGKSYILLHSSRLPNFVSFTASVFAIAIASNILRVLPISCRTDQSLQMYLLLLQNQPPRIAFSARPCHPTIEYPIFRHKKFRPSVTISVTKKPGCNISGTESGIIKPLVAKRSGKQMWNKKKNEKKWFFFKFFV